MSKVSTLLDLPKYLDEAMDALLIFFQSLKAFRQEEPCFDILGYIFLAIALIAISSLCIKYLKNKKQNRPP
jgi:hypothetical protein